MVKITHKEIAKLVGRSESYVRQLLHRRSITLKPVDIEKLFDLVAEYRKA